MYTVIVTIEVEHFNVLKVGEYLLPRDEVEKMFADLDNGPVYFTMTAGKFEVKSIEILSLSKKSQAWFHLGLNPVKVD